MKRPDLQEGIFYDQRESPPNSFCILFLDVVKGSSTKDVGKALTHIWAVLQALKKGITKDLDLNPRHLLTGNLRVAIGYGPELFAQEGLRKTKPAGLKEPWNFNIPSISAKPTIMDGCELSYSPNIRINHASMNHVVIQLTAENEFYTKRALVEIWKELTRMKKENLQKSILLLHRSYFGFRSETFRNWLGFHDGVSNIESRKRLGLIAIDNNKNDLLPDDRWTTGGTYLAFLRIVIDLDRWIEVNRYEQELLIGREKVSGCPLLGVDNNEKPVKDPRCPVKGTYEIIESGNEYFRDHPPYGFQRNLPRGVKDTVLNYSHIGRTRPLDKNYKSKSDSFSIFRQGFEYLESREDYPGFEVGLNFVSFQNNIERFFKTLKYGFNRAGFTTQSGKPLPGLEVYLSVTTAGIFVVPPVAMNEVFPGSTIFLDSKKTTIPSILY
jgi:Dyp-type peroxidase family